MNIYAIKGHKVRFANPKAGYPAQQEKAAKFLALGEIYTVQSTDVDSSSTQVYLKEIPNQFFNSVLFEDVAPQSPEADRRHPDYKKYNP